MARSIRWRQVAGGVPVGLVAALAYLAVTGGLPAIGNDDAHDQAAQVTAVPVGPGNPAPPESLPTDVMREAVATDRDPPYAHIPAASPSEVMLTECENRTDMHCRIVRAMAEGSLSPGEYSRDELESALSRAER
jgi:hypothetical protein